MLPHMVHVYIEKFCSGEKTVIIAPCRFTCLCSLYMIHAKHGMLFHTWNVLIVRAKSIFISTKEGVV